MSEISFETALDARVEEMLDACTKCGKCVEVCPSVKPAGIAEESSTDIISGILDIVRTGKGLEASRKWAEACMLSGECIKACDYGVNPRFLLAMARVALAKNQNELPERRRQGVTTFRDVSRDVTMLSRLQLDGETLERLGQKSASALVPAEAPDFVFYTGCNVLRTPHIALLALDIMDALGITYQVMGGPTHCCGIAQLRSGDVEMSGRMGANSIEKMSHSKSGQVISWCPSCYVQFSETTIPALERQGGSRPFEMTPFLRFLRERLAQLTPLLRQPVEMRIALHRHPGVAGVMEAAEEILQAIPGTVYTTALTKIADHGGFGEDDVHVALLVSNPAMHGGKGRRVDDPVETRQIACTILKTLDMDCDGLMSEAIEPSRSLPHATHRRASWDDVDDQCDDDHDGWHRSHRR